jgi:hypothetical protein
MSLLLLFAGRGSGGGEEGGEDGRASCCVASDHICDGSVELELEATMGLKKASIEPRLTDEVCRNVFGSFGS